MNKIPFSVYDFFGYLAPGFLILAAADFARGGGWLFRDNTGFARSRPTKQMLSVWMIELAKYDLDQGFIE
jgi:hypothetical protein